jgi:hypothetical protein
MQCLTHHHGISRLSIDTGIMCDPDQGPDDVSDWASALWALPVPSSLMCPMVFVMLPASILGLNSKGGGSTAFFT